MNKFKFQFKGTSAEVAYDGNSDGEDSLALKLQLGEVYQELMAKGEAKVDAVVSFKRNGGKIQISVDTDKDGEAALTLDADILEGIEESF